MTENQTSKSQATVEVKEGGPLKISGNFILKDIARNFEKTPGEIWLCRCGKSSDKPYCDNSHNYK